MRYCNEFYLKRRVRPITCLAIPAWRACSVRSHAHGGPNVAAQRAIFSTLLKHLVLTMAFGVIITELRWRTFSPLTPVVWMEWRGRACCWSRRWFFSSLLPPARASDEPASRPRAVFPICLCMSLRWLGSDVIACSRGWQPYLKNSNRKLIWNGVWRR